MKIRLGLNEVFEEGNYIDAPIFYLPNLRLITTNNLFKKNVTSFLGDKIFESTGFPLLE